MLWKNEIGSEFWDVPICDLKNHIFPDHVQWYISGRSALCSIINELNDCKSVALPAWCCESIIKPFVDAHYFIHFYPVYLKNGHLVQDVKSDADVLFLMDYFGYTGLQPDISEYKGVVIRDVTHSLFSSIYSDADYYFGSLRKWCGVWTGGYAWTNDGHRLEPGRNCGQEYIALRKRAMDAKCEYINSGTTTKEYLKVFDEAEDLLSSFNIAPADERDIEMAYKLDVETIRKKRNANSAFLRESFSEWLIFPTLSPADTAMFVPIMVPDGKRDALRRYLIKHDIYCPIHWPVSKYIKLDERTAYIYQNEISLVCDQRYTVEDMSRMADTIKAFCREM